jgi:hypothetical protein
VRRASQTVIPGNSLELADYISQVGFRLVDETESAVR